MTDYTGNKWKRADRKHATMGYALEKIEHRLGLN